MVLIFADKEIKAVKIPISQTVAEDIKPSENSTSFKTYGENFILPWPGAFFVQNALLCLETARELGISPKKLSKHLKTLPHQERTLHTKTIQLNPPLDEVNCAISTRENPLGDKGELEGVSSTATILYDLYSQNPDGTLKAIEHLGRSKEDKIFIGMPLLELGKDSKQIHEQIFSSLKEIDATVYWIKNDHKKLGKEILGDKFHLINPRKKKDIQILNTKYQGLNTNTAILLEGRIPEKILNIFK